MVAQVLTQAVGETCRDAVPEKEDADIVPTSPAVSDTEVDELLSLYDAIQKRKGEQIYPLVLPAEVASDGLQREFADEQYALVRDLEAVQFQSFLDDCYEAFRLDLPADPETSESVRHALWARQNYYLCSKQFFIDQSFASKVMAHRWDAEKFLPLLAVASIEDDEERQVAAAICKRMQQQWITAFDSVLWAKWGKIEKRKSVKELQARFWTFIEEEYFVVLAEVVERKVTEADAEASLEQAFKHKVLALWEEICIRRGCGRIRFALAHQVCSGEVVHGKGGAHVESDLALEKEILALWEKENLKSKHLPKEFPKDFRIQALRELRQGRKRTSAEAFVSPVADAILEQQVLGIV